MVTQFISPFADAQEVKASIGLFAQDQWLMGPVTLNFGLRYEYHQGYAPAVNQMAGVLGPDAVSFPQVDCLPCWHDINPRLSGAWDVFQDGKTAVKASIGRYVAAVTTEHASAFGPSGARVGSTSRSWIDTDSDFFPDCDLRSRDANGECGEMDNRAFGQNVARTRPDPDWIEGWGNRGYNWKMSLELDRQLAAGVAMNVGYFRSWWGNQTVVDNVLVTPADYDPYCITAPVDSRLPGGISGSQICGLYDLNPAKFGQVDTVQTLASNFGTYSEVYNGFDVNLMARLPRGATFSGGWNIGNSVNSASVTGAIGLALGTNSKTNSCFVVDSPQQLYNCESGNPYQQRIKLNTAWPLPRDFQVAVVYQNLPGPNFGADVTVPNGQIAPSLGRPLSGGRRNTTVSVVVPNSAFLDERLNQLDVRLSKIFRMGRVRFQGNFDLYNVFNSSAILAVNSSFGPNYLRPTQILDARLAKFSVQMDF